MIAFTAPWKEIEPEAAAFARGEADAFAEVFNRHHQRLLGLARWFLARDTEHNEKVDHNDAEDIVQATMIEVWEKRRGPKHYTVNKPVFAWLWRRMWFVYLRRRNYSHDNQLAYRRAGSLDVKREEIGHEVTASHTDPSEIAADREARTWHRRSITLWVGVVREMMNEYGESIEDTPEENMRLELALSRLKDSYLQTVMFRASGMSYREIAERRGVALRSVQDLFVYARRALVEELRATEDHSLFDEAVSQLGAWEQQIIAYRQSGYKFNEIGEALGMTKEGAFQRYKKAMRNADLLMQCHGQPA